MIRFFLAGLPVIMALVAQPGFAQAPAGSRPTPLAAHTAIYDLALDTSRAVRGVDSARGRLVFEFTGSACEGYATSFRQVVAIGAAGQDIVMDVRTTNFEDGEGKSFRYSSETSQNGDRRDETDGNATRESAGITATITKPKPERAEIAGDVVFPTEHLKRILAAARAGQTILEVPVYDGADSGTKHYLTTAVIGRRIGPGEGEIEAQARMEPLGTLPRWPVTISYFEAGKDSATPAYSIAFELFENGVSRALVIDYNDFRLRGTLQQLKFSTEPPCDR
ncbi:MAG: cell envelope integrity EipB family protein [Alphaproteobacteria bacterium]